MGVGEWLRIEIAVAVPPPSRCGVLAHRHRVREAELVLQRG
jgi:hypothetical protein